MRASLVLTELKEYRPVFNQHKTAWELRTYGFVLAHLFACMSGLKKRKQKHRRQEEMVF